MPRRLLICNLLLPPCAAAITRQDEAAPSVAVTGTKDPSRYARLKALR